MSSLGPKRYDAFLSYNSQDRPAVHAVAERLKGEGLELYLEEWELAPGREFQPARAGALHESKTCVVVLGPNGLGPWQKQELQVASTGGPATRRSPSSRCCCPAPSGPGGGTWPTWSSSSTRPGSNSSRRSTMSRPSAA